MAFSSSFAAELRQIGRRIRELRKARRWSQERLAHEADISRTYMGTIELGTKQPTLWTVHKLAKALRVSTGELLLPAIHDRDEVRDVLAGIELLIRDKARTQTELRKIHALIEAYVRKGR